MRNSKALGLLLVAPALGCFSEMPDGLAPAQPAATTVAFDLFHRPLPEIPLPNDIATRFDPASATKLRINASMIAPTQMEARLRRHIDQLDGWGTMQPITIPFTGPLDVASILAGHRDENYDLSNDVIYVINVDRKSPKFGRIAHLDMGEGNYPLVLEEIDGYWKNDTRGQTISLIFEEEDEDLNGNGILDPGEDTDSDGLLDKPNYLPGLMPARDDLAGRADALMTFYERATNTLIANTLVPLDERTTYAVVVTRRLLDANGEPVGSPFEFVNHAGQTKALEALPDVLPDGLALEDVAFAFAFTTQSIEAPMVALRDGLYGHGVQAHLATDFPAEVTKLFPLRDRREFPAMKNHFIAYAETWREAFPTIAQQLLGQKEDSEFLRVTREQLQYVDYFVVGQFESPQLFDREDETGKWLPFDDQSWPEDLDRVPARARSETIYFTLAVPRKEISKRKDGKPADVVILGHGYTGNRFDAINFAGVLARHGLATIAIDGPSHGLPLTATERELALGLLADYGLRPFTEAVLVDRAHDQNNDGATDSGADFWTSYLFHTRDMVRQFALDYMQLVRVIRSFDGVQRWSFDVNGDGQTELAGDFDGDGVVDIGALSTLSAVGGSLGGMMATILAGLEPEVTIAVPISGGGKLGSIGLRSRQGGVREGFIMRVLGPMIVGTIETDGMMLLETIVPDLNDDATLKLGKIEGVVAGDTIVVENLNNGERGCGVVGADGKFRAGVAANLGDRIDLQVFSGLALLGDEECSLQDGVTPKLVVNTFEEEIEFQGETYAAGSPMLAMCEGLGLRRAHPSFRRLAGFAQLVFDPADPASWARHIQQERLTFPGTGHTTGAHALIMTTIGDMGVPASGGTMVGRAAGLIPYLENDRRYGKSLNRMLIETHVNEAVNTLKRYVSPTGSGVGVHLDVENFGQGTDQWGPDYPRLATPLHIGMNQLDRLGGKSAAIFPMGNETGEHGFSPPGEMTDKARRACRNACTVTEGENPCGCNTARRYDIGHFLFNMAGRYMRSGGRVLEADLCQSRDDCADLQPPPEPRDVTVME